MSSIAPTETAAQPTIPKWVPAPELIYRLSVGQYEALVASGVFTERDRFHLINGYLVAKMTEYPPHAAACDGLRQAVEAKLPPGWYARPDKPVRIPIVASEPEPDLAVARGSWRDYEERHPEVADLALVAEIASSSLSEDRSMTRIYGAGGIPVYWIVNLVDRQVEVYTGPGKKGYDHCLILKPGDHVPLVIDGVERGRIAVDDLLPRRPA
jgi:Uma2 family endonuclease